MGEGERRGGDEGEGEGPHRVRKMNKGSERERQTSITDWPG